MREKHLILMRSVLSADKTPHTTKEEVYRYKVTARDACYRPFDRSTGLCIIN